MKGAVLRVYLIQDFGRGRRNFTGKAYFERKIAISGLVERFFGVAKLFKFLFSAGEMGSGKYVNFW